MLAAKNGLVLWVNSVVPTLFPFFVASELLMNTNMVNILGNLIDNAIEASVDEKEPYIELTIKQEKSFILIKVVNKYSREFSGNMETKKKDKIFHGIGIGSVNDIVKKYDGDFSIDKMGDEVIAKIIIPNM